MVDYIGRALVAEALREWRDQLQASATVSALSDLSYSEAKLIDLAGAHPGGLAPLFANRPTLLSSLIREPAALAAAAHRARVIRDAAEEVREATGVWTAAMVVGTAVWSEAGHRRELPILTRPVLWDDARDDDAFITLVDEVAINPVVLALLRARDLGDDADTIAAMVPEHAGGTTFDPRPVWDAVRDLAEAFGPEFEVRPRLLLGAFDDPEQRLLEDLDHLGNVLRGSDVVAAVAGDHEAAARLAVPIPAFPTGDRDPFAERGLGDLDDAQFAALDAVATGRSVFVQGGPGFDTAGMVAAIAADGAASGRCLMVVAGRETLLGAIAGRLEALGAGEILVDGGQDARARSQLLASITMAGSEVDDDEIRAVGERLLASRREVQSRFDALHRTHRPWDVSAFDAVQAVVRLTSTEPAPATGVRLGPDAGAIVVEHGFGSVADAIVKRLGRPDAVETETAAVTMPQVELVPWWSAVTDDAAEGAALDEALATLLVRHVPKMRSEAAVAAHETGVDAATSLSAWSAQVQLFTELRATLEIFSPAVFHRSLHDIVDATAPASERETSIARRDRRALVRRAVELLRPGRTKAGLHGHLVAAHDQALRWRAICSAGGWPVVPDDFDIFADRMDQVLRLWARIAGPITAVTGRDDLPEVTWDEMTRVLSELAEGIPGTLEAARARPLERDLEDVGLGALLEDLRSRGADAAQVRRDLEFSWWASAYESIVTQDPRLSSHGALGGAVREFLDADQAFSQARVGPLMRAVTERRRGAIVRNPDAARDLFASLMEGGTKPYRDLWRDYGPVVGALRPVVLATAEQVTRIAPAERVIDTVVIAGAESLALAQAVPAIARARQVVVVGDAESATRSAVSVLAALLPRITLSVAPQPRDPRVTGVLGAMSYGRVLQALPTAGSGSRLEVVVLDAVGSRVAGSAAVESTRAEVMAVVDRVDIASRTLPRRSLAVVAGNELHAHRIRDALAEATPSLAERATVVAIGEAGGLDVDEVILSLGYARDARGTLPHDVGVLASDWGRQALAQALVASHSRVTVVTSLTAEQLGLVADATDDPEALDALRELVSRRDAAPVSPERQEPGPSDWLLADIAARLREEGYAVRLRYGFGEDTIALAVGGPRDRGYRVAVVTDETPPGVQLSVRDRLRWQQDRLERLGWIVVPLWTLEVFTDPDAALRRIRDALEAEIAAVTSALPTISLPVARPPSRKPEPPPLFIDLDEPDAEVADAASDEPAVGSDSDEEPDAALADASGDEPVVPGDEPDAEPDAPSDEPDAEPAVDEVAADDPSPEELIAEQPTLDGLEVDEPSADDVDAPEPQAGPDAEPELELDLEPEPESEAEREPEAESEPEPEPEPEAAPETIRPRPPTMGFGVPKLAQPLRRAPRTPPKGTSRPLIPTRAWEDEDAGWGGGESSSRDEELKRDKPPHW